MQMEMVNAKLQEAGQGSMKMTILVRKSEPDISYMINDAQKSYARIDVKEMQKSIPASQRDRKWSVKRLGSDKVAGYACERAIVNQEGSETDNRSASRRRSAAPRASSARADGTPRPRGSKKRSRRTASRGCRSG